MTLLRFAGGALLVLPFLPRRRIADLDGLGWRRGAGLALAGGPLFGLAVYSAFALAPLAHATVFPPSCVMVTGMALSALLLGERPGPYQLGGGALLLLGLLALAYDGLAGGGRLTWLGDLLFALAGCSWGVFTFLLRRWRVAPLRAVAAVTLPAPPPLVPAWLLIPCGGPPPVPGGAPPPARARHRAGVAPDHGRRPAAGAGRHRPGAVVLPGRDGRRAGGGRVRRRGAGAGGGAGLGAAVVHAGGDDALRHPGAGPAADPARAARDGARHRGPAARDPRPGASGGAPAGLTGATISRNPFRHAVRVRQVHVWPAFSRWKPMTD